MTAFI